MHLTKYDDNFCYRNKSPCHAANGDLPARQTPDVSLPRPQIASPDSGYSVDAGTQTRMIRNHGVRSTLVSITQVFSCFGILSGTALYQADSLFLIRHGLLRK